MKTVPERVAALRAEMKKRGIDTYVIYSADAHQSEYVAAYWQARKYISGFTGSAGTVVVTAERAGCWVDGRYFLQGEQQLKGSGIELMRMGEPGVPPLEDFIIDETPEGGTVGVDGRSISSEMAEQYMRDFQKKGLTLTCEEDLIGCIWDERPALPQDPVFEMPLAYTGESRAEKLARLRGHMAEVGADHYLVTTLDASAWLLNHRGNDIYATPVAYAYTLVGRESCSLYIEEKKVPEELRAAFEADGVGIRPYDSIAEDLKTLHGTLACDLKQVNALLKRCIPETVTVLPEAIDTVESMKGVKNPVEQENFRKAHVRDGAVMATFLKWVKDHAGEHPTECEAAAVLDQMRCDQENSLGISFTTIAGYGPNGAIIHYGPQPETCARLDAKGFFLVDSGGHYLEGTTDITRTIACGPLTDEEKEIYTLVLKGHLALGRAVFIKGTTGTNVEILARLPLYEKGLNYKHGTGHGVGHVLCVHEGPMNIRYTWNPVALVPGMVVSDEPGYYEAGKFGVRIENLVMVVPYMETEWGEFYRMDPITLCPYERDAIVKDMLNEEEIRQIDDYHRKVYETISPLVDEDVREFLKEATRPL